jgi:hypothetical protein
MVTPIERRTKIHLPLPLYMETLCSGKCNIILEILEILQAIYPPSTSQCQIS